MQRFLRWIYIVRFFPTDFGSYLSLCVCACVMDRSEWHVGGASTSCYDRARTMDVAVIHGDNITGQSHTQTFISPSSSILLTYRRDKYNQSHWWLGSHCILNILEKIKLNNSLAFFKENFEREIIFIFCQNIILFYFFTFIWKIGH